MHPLLASGRRLAAYLLAWVPVLLLLSFITQAAGGFPWWQEVSVLAPTCGIFAFACLSPWYLCRALPLHKVGWTNLLVTFGAAAAAGSLIFVGTFKLMELALGTAIPS